MSQVKENQVRDKKKFNWPITILLIIGCVTIFFPLYMAVVIAFKQPSEMTNDIAGALSLPVQWSLSNFQEAMRVTDFWHSLGNSLLITVSTVVLALVIHSLAGYPMSTVSAHVSVCPNHQNGRVTPFKTRGICAMQGAFGYELDLGKLTEQEMEEAREQIAMYNEHCELFQKGNYYRLTSPMENRDFTAWSYVLPDGSKAVLSVVYTDLHANPKPLWVKWKGLARDGIYVLDGREYTGTALMQGGMVLPKPQCNYDSYIVFIENIAFKGTSRND